MADSNIGSLPQIEKLDDDSLFVAEQQGEAMKVTGAQFKEFGRQAVVGQVQGYVDQAEAAANRATDAVSAVTDMTVEAATLPTGQSATVTKSTKNGKVNLAFGLPRGERGVAGPAGETGPRGPQGPAGKGLTILGYYDTEDALRAAVPLPSAGDAYGVGTAAPYDIYVYDGVKGDWVNNGPLSGGGGGGPLPENVVTAEGGASLEFPLILGNGPHTVRFDEEEEAPLNADDIVYSGEESVKDAIDGLKASVSDGKALVASAITDKGVPTAQDATFAQMADNIGQISGGSDTSDATATSFDILSPKTAYTAAGKVEGAIPTLLGQSIMPGTADKIISGGQYLGGDQVIKGDGNLSSGNIKKGVTLFGVEGALESTFQAVLTVTADAGAVVTAKHTDGIEVSALSQTGTVVLDLPKEGTWTVSAVRGAAQYNTVTIEVTSQYNASLTAELHIEFVANITPLSVARSSLAAASNGMYTLFGGGYDSGSGYGPGNYKPNVDVYNMDLTHSTAGDLTTRASNLAATVIGGYILFGGGLGGEFSALGGTPKFLGFVSAYDENLVRSMPADLSEARGSLAAATVGNHALFGGGSGNTSTLNIVDAYNDDLSRSSPSSGLISPSSYLAAASNDSYVVFGGGSAVNVTAYNSALTRTLPVSLVEERKDLSAVRAGNYVLFAGGANGSKTCDTVEAYDMFLTRTLPEPLNSPRKFMASTTLNGFAILSGSYEGTTGDIYDAYLVRTSLDNMQNYSSSAAAPIGNYALLGGGINGVAFDTVAAYRYV